MGSKDRFKPVLDSKGVKVVKRGGKVDPNVVRTDLKGKGR
jgi:hypothetical protein